MRLYPIDRPRTETKTSLKPNTIGEKSREQTVPHNERADFQSQVDPSDLISPRQHGVGGEPGLCGARGHLYRAAGATAASPRDWSFWIARAGKSASPNSLTSCAWSRSAIELTTLSGR